MKKKIIRALSLLIVLFILSGCSLEPQKNKPQSERELMEELIETTELSERQKEILAEAGFSQDIDKLDYKQQKSIIQIELGLQYLEEKYGKKFKYERFYNGDYGSLVARALDDGKCRKFTTEIHWDEKKGEYYFTDIYYKKVLAADAYENLLKDYMNEKYPDVEYFDDIDIFDMGAAAKDEVTTDNVGASVILVVKSCYSNSEDYKSMLNHISEWMHNYAYNQSVYLQVMSEEDYKEANYYNYSRLMREDRYEYRFDSSIKSDGTIKIRELE